MRLKPFAAAALLLLARPALAADPSTFRIAAVIGLSGPLAVIGADMRRGVEVALDERNRTVLGVPIEITWDDSEGKPQVTVQKAASRIAAGANMVFGEIGSPATTALAGLTEQREVPPLITFAADNALTAPGRLHWAFRTGKNVNSTVGVTVGFAERNGVTKVFGITPDYDARAIAGTSSRPLPPRATSRWSARSSTQRRRATSRSCWTMRYHWSEDLPANKDFVARYTAKFGENPSGNAGDAYDGMRWWLRVVDGTHSWNKADWVAAMSHSALTDSVEGRKEMGVCDHQAWQIALAGVGVENTAPDLPKYGMTVMDVLQPDQIYKPCP